MAIQLRDEIAPLDEPAAGQEGIRTRERALPMPTLPAEAQPDPTWDAAGGWLDEYVRYAMARSPMTPWLFHQSSGLWLVSTAIARRLKVPMAFGDVYPNLFVVWVASTTLYRKTTALDVAESLAERVMRHLLAPQDATPEALLSDMAGREPQGLSGSERERWRTERDFAAQRGLIRDEMSGLLASAGREYMAGLIEALLKFFDCAPHFTRSTRQQGRIEVLNSYLTFLGASTPAALAPHLMADGLWSKGWWPRFALLCPERAPAWREADDMAEPPSLAEKLKELLRRLPQPSWPNPPQELDVELGQGVGDTWARYNKALSFDLLTEDLDHRLHGTYGRLPTQVLKIATILAAMDWPEGADKPCIELPQLARAIGIGETWRASAHRLLETVDRSGYQGQRARIVQLVSAADSDGLTFRDLCKAMRRVKPDALKETVRQMVEAGDVEEFDAQAGPQGGRPTTRYRLVAE